MRSSCIVTLLRVLIILDIAGASVNCGDGAMTPQIWIPGCQVKRVSLLHRSCSPGIRWQRSQLACPSNTRIEDERDPEATLSCELCP